MKNNDVVLIILAKDIKEKIIIFSIKKQVKKNWKHKLVNKITITPTTLISLVQIK